MDDELMTKLLSLKISASGCTSKLQGIERVRDAWEIGESMPIARKNVCIEVYVEYAMENFEAVVDMTEQLLRGPPSYTQHPDERRQRLMELELLVSRANAQSVDLHQSVKELRGKVTYAIDSRVEEVYVRTGAVEKESSSMLEQKCVQSRAEKAQKGDEPSKASRIWAWEPVTDGA